MAKSGLIKNQVEHTARLANLPLTISETKTFQEQLSEVVEYVQKIEKVHSAQEIVHRGVEGEAGRKDAVKPDECLAQKDALSGTESKHNGLFVVPAIFEES